MKEFRYNNDVIIPIEVSTKSCKGCTFYERCVGPISRDEIPVCVEGDKNYIYRVKR